MKLWIMSDLHQEFPELAWRPARVPEHDILVLAGDIDVTCAKAVQYARSMTDKPIVMVAGNHEFYGQNLSEQLRIAQSLSDDRLNYLENRAVVIGDVRFVGATLWTDFELFSDWMSRDCEKEAYRFMNDFRVIAIDPDEIDLSTPRHGRDDKFHFRTRHAANLHAASAAFIWRTLNKPFAGSTVVVTHHAPHERSIPKRFQKDLLSACFASDLSTLIKSGKPNLWIHGHVHHSFDYRVGRTRIISNPRGYENELAHFNPELVVDLT